MFDEAYCLAFHTSPARPCTFTRVVSHNPLWACFYLLRFISQETLISVTSKKASSKFHSKSDGKQKKKNLYIATVS